MYFPYFKIEILTSRSLTTSLSSEQLGPKLLDNDSMQIDRNYNLRQPYNHCSMQDI